MFGKEFGIPWGIVYRKRLMAAPGAKSLAETTRTYENLSAHYKPEWLWDCNAVSHSS